LAISELHLEVEKFVSEIVDQVVSEEAMSQPENCPKTDEEDKSDLPKPECSKEVVQEGVSPSIPSSNI
jgi:hypothetical protein